MNPMSQSLPRSRVDGSPRFLLHGLGLVRLPLVALAACLAARRRWRLAAPAQAQETRREIVEAHRPTRPRRSSRVKPPRAERVFKRVQDELIDEPSGLYPLFGSVYSGGGFALGAGYRGYYGDNTHWDAKALLLDPQLPAGRALHRFVEPRRRPDRPARARRLA